MLYPFRVLHATTVEEATSELARLGERARVYAGGTELLLLHRYGLIRLDTIVDVKGISALRGVSENGRALRIGASLTHHQVELHAMVREYLPAFAYAESRIANIRVRNQGTLGGNLCFNDPHSDPGTVLLVYDAKVKTVGSLGERRMALEDFFVGTYETALKPGELLVEVEVPLLPEGWKSSYLRVHRLERPTLGVAAAARWLQGRLDEVRLAVGCVGPWPLRLTDLEKNLVGTDLNEAGQIVSETEGYLREILEPTEDILGSADYKLTITRVLLNRALGETWSGNGAEANG
jgi:carbon-monoxide dehydrogenase medium subunit